MIIYNVTTKVDWSIHEAWVKWMQEIHIPEIMHTGCFTGNSLLRLLEVDESEGPTYAAQYHAHSKADYNRYIELHSSVLRQSAHHQWGNKIISFRSLMEVIN